MVDEKRKIFLTEYKEGNKLTDVYHRISWMASSIFLPVSFGLVAVSFSPQILSLTWIELLPLAGASVSLFVYWWCYVRRYASYLSSIYDRLQCLEESLGMHLHRQIDKNDKARCLKWRLKHVNSITLILMILLWSLRLFFAPLIP